MFRRPRKQAKVDTSYDRTQFVSKEAKCRHFKGIEKKLSIVERGFDLSLTY